MDKHEHAAPETNTYGRSPEPLLKFANVHAHAPKRFLIRFRERIAQQTKILKYFNSIGLIAGILFFLVSYFLNMFATNPTGLDAIGFASIAFALIIDRTFSAVERDADSKRSEDRHDEIMTRFDMSRMDIESAFSAQYVGTADTALETVISKISLSHGVKNTYITVGVSDGPLTTYHSKVVAAYDAFLSSSQTCIWQDLVSVNELFDNRFLLINPTGEHGEHKIGVLRNNMPIINFILLSKRGDVFSSEIYFGWTKNNLNSPIFHSMDSKLVRMFDDYFDMLWKDRTFETFTIRHEKAADKLSESLTVNKVGKWNTFSFEIGRDLAELEFTSFGFVEVGFFDTHPFIEGVVYHNNFEDCEPIRHTNVVHTGNKLYFEFQSKGTMSRRNGFCIYEFEKYGDYDVIVGYFTDDDIRTRRYLIGVRINDSVDINELFNEEQIRNIIEKNRNVVASIYKSRGYSPRSPWKQPAAVS
jgi:hypothetical protein